jgi:hypothetical protein
MNAELIQAWAAVLSALAWPLAVLIALLLFRGLIARAVRKGGAFRFGLKDLAEFSIEPARGLRPPSDATGEARLQLTKGAEQELAPPAGELPPDYYFLNHTSFLRKDMQAEFQRRTGVPFPHYDIRVVVDSYYRGALERIELVEYILHSAYPNPVQYRRNAQDKFLLKELANGEYVLMAKVYLKDRRDPLLLQRYITLWESGSRLA